LGPALILELLGLTIAVQGNFHHKTIGTSVKSSPDSKNKCRIYISTSIAVRDKVRDANYRKYLLFIRGNVQNHFLDIRN